MLTKLITIYASQIIMLYTLNPHSAVCQLSLNKTGTFFLFLNLLGLRFCARAFSSCGERGPLFIAVRGLLHYRGLSCCGAQAPDAQPQ